MKKIFTLFCVTLSSLVAMANGVKIGDLYYLLDSTNYTASVAMNNNHIYKGDVVIPNTIVHAQHSYVVTSTEAGAFLACYNLTSVTIPNTVMLGEKAFYLCSGLISVNIPNIMTKIGSHMFYRCKSLKSITIPNSVKIIESYAFDDCSSLTSLVLGSSVTNIYMYAFNNCTNLESITCLAKTPPMFGNPPNDWGQSALGSVPRNIPLYVPVSSVLAYQAAAQWNEFDIQPLLVDVDPIASDTTQLSWLPVDSASLYKLRIYSEQIELDTTLLIEADSLNGGISIPVTLAPNRVRRMPMDDIGSVVVITLEPNSGATKDTPFRVTVSTTSKDKIDILFDLEVLKGEKTIKQESGSFALNAPVLDGLEDIPVPRFSVSSGIFDLYGRHYPLRQWNQLPAGIYILREGEKASKVIKR